MLTLEEGVSIPSTIGGTVIKRNMGQIKQAYKSIESSLRKTLSKTSDPRKLMVAAYEMERFLNAGDALSFVVDGSYGNLSIFYGFINMKNGNGFNWQANSANDYLSSKSEKEQDALVSTFLVKRKRISLNFNSKEVYSSEYW